MATTKAAMIKKVVKFSGVKSTTKKVSGTVKGKRNLPSKVVKHMTNKGGQVKINKNIPKSIIKRNNKQIPGISEVDFFQAYEQAINNPEVAFVAICPISPDIAAWILALNENNRKIMPKFIKRLANQMILGRWMEGADGSMIQFDHKGRVIDAQHRLSSVVDSGMTLKFMILFNKAPESFAIIDDCKPKQIKDMMRILGLTNESTLQTFINTFKKFEMGDPTLSSSNLVSNRESIEIIERNEDIVNSVEFIKKIKIKSIMPESAAAVLHYIFTDKSKEDANSFFEALAHGTGLNEGDPVYVLRERLMKSKMIKLLNARLSKNHLMAITIKAWNACRNDRRDVSRLYWSEKNELFPSIV